MARRGARDTRARRRRASAQSPKWRRPARASPAAAAASGRRCRPTRPRSSARNSSAAESGVHCTCVAARSNCGASARIAPPRRGAQRQVALVVERALGVEGTEDQPLAVRRIAGRRVVRAGRVRQHVLAARGQVDGHDVALVHEVRLVCQVGRDRQLAPVRRDVVVVRRRLPRRQRELKSRQQVLAMPGAHVAGEDVRLAAVGHPVIPVARRRALGHVRLDLGVLALLQALALRGIGRQVRPHPGHERDALAVRKPLDGGRTRRDLRDAFRLAAVRGDPVDLRLGVVAALGGERDPLAVGRPARLAVLVAGGQPPRARDRAASPCRRRACPSRQCRSETATARSGFRRCPWRTTSRPRRPARPSGDSVGLPMRLICHSASTSSGGKRAGTAGAAGGHGEGLKLE